MKKMDLFEIIIKIIGDTSPSGCSSTDDHHIENAKQLQELLCDLVMQVSDDTKCIFDYRASMQRVSKVAYATIKEINTITQDCINDIEHDRALKE